MNFNITYYNIINRLLTLHVSTTPLPSFFTVGYAALLHYFYILMPLGGQLIWTKLNHLRLIGILVLNKIFDLNLQLRKLFLDRLIVIMQEISLTNTRNLLSLRINVHWLLYKHFYNKICESVYIQ